MPPHLHDCSDSIDLGDSLKTSLVELGFDFEKEPSWDSCDEEFKTLQSRLESSHITELVEKPFCPESNTVLIGTVITEAISAAYWTDALLVCLASWLPNWADDSLVLSVGHQNGRFSSETFWNIHSEWPRVWLSRFHWHSSIWGFVICLSHARYIRPAFEANQGFLYPW
jgi:hypothetical protein